MPIKIDNLSYIYSQGTPFEKKALDGISVTINDNEMIGIIGHTGSGKSTFVQHLNALLYPTVGSVEVDGVLTTSDKKVLKSIRRKVGLVFQYPEHQLFELTVFQDVAFGPKNCGVEGQELSIRVESALKAVGLDETYYEKSPFELSGGQKRRVAIAGVIAMNPKFLILDEPTAGLDPIGREEILSMIQRLNTEKGITIIFVSHSMEDIAEYVKRIIVFDKGKILFDDEPIKVFAERTALKNCGLDVPISTKLIDCLNERSTEKIMPTLTANETVRAIMEWLKKEENHD